MAARSAVHTLVSEDPTLAGIGVTNTYPSNSVDTPPEELFIVTRWEPSTVAFKQLGTDRVSLWVHDRQRDYGRIDLVIHRLKELLTSSVHLDGGDGWILTTAEYIGEGPDLADVGYGTITRYVEFTAVSRYTAP